MPRRRCWWSETVRSAATAAVVGTDFSAASAKALNVAASLFPDASVELAHCYLPVFPGRVEAETGRQYAVSQAQAEMAAFLARPDVAPLRSRLQERLVDGHPARALSALACEPPHGLIAIGAHGAGGFIRASIGGRASDILTTATCDVLVVRSAGRQGFAGEAPKH